MYNIITYRICVSLTFIEKFLNGYTCFVETTINFIMIIIFFCKSKREKNPLGTLIWDRYSISFNSSAIQLCADSLYIEVIDDYDHLHTHNYALHMFVFCSLYFDLRTRNVAM